MGIITLNRPERLNALSLALQDEAASLLGELDKDDEIGAVILTGAPRADGRPCFPAGSSCCIDIAIGDSTIYKPVFAPFS